MADAPAPTIEGGLPSTFPNDKVTAVAFVAEAGRQMLESSTSVSEVEDRLREFLPVVGLDGAALDAQLGYITVSYWTPDLPAPITRMVNVDVSRPRLETLSGTAALLDHLQAGQIDLAEAELRLGALAARPSLASRYALLAILLSVAGWVVFLSGIDLMTVGVALLATMTAWPVDRVVSRLGLPSIMGTSLAAVILAGVPNLLAAAGASVQVGPAVVGGLFIYLPGRALVSAIIDGLANAPVSAVARGLQAIVTAGALAVGMLLGSQLGLGLGLDYDPNLASVPILVSVLAAGVAVFGLSIAWTVPRGQLLPTALIGAGGWLVFALLTGGTMSAADWPAAVGAAAVVGLAGSITATVQGAAASVYTSVAILPLVPGFVLYQAMLAFAQGNEGDAIAALGSATVTSLAIAIGVAIGLALGRNLRATSRGVMRRVDAATGWLGVGRRAKKDQAKPAPVGSDDRPGEEVHPAK